MLQRQQPNGKGAKTLLLCLRGVIFVIVLSLEVCAQTGEAVENLAAELMKAQSDQRTTLLAENKPLVTTELGKELIKQGNLLLLSGRYSPALDVYLLAHKVAEQIGDREGIATASLDLGTTLYFQGNFGLALERYRKARELFTNAGNQLEAAKALSGLALIYKELQRNNEALKVYEEVLKEFEALNDNEEIANTLNNIGAVHYAQGNYSAASKALLRSTQLEDNSDNIIRIADALYMQGEYAQAAQYYQKSIKDFAATNNTAGVISALGGAANSFYYEGRYDEAFESYRKNLAIQRELEDFSGMSLSLQGMGNVSRARGDFGMALDHYLLSVSVAKESTVKVPTATTLGSIGLVRAMQGNTAAAHDYYAQSLAEFEASGDKVGRARMLALIGNLYFVQASHEAALESYRQSLALREDMNDKAAQANLRVGIGTVLLAQKQFASALDHYQKALQTFEALGNKASVADALTRIADVHLAEEDYAQALTTAERAVTLSNQVDDDVLWYAETLKGKALRALSRSDDASVAFSEAIRIIESSRSQIFAAETGGGRNELLPYLAKVELLIEQNKLAEAFEYAERARDKALLGLLGNTGLKITTGSSPLEQAEERKLIAEVISLKLQLDRETQSRAVDKSRHDALSNRLSQARAGYESFRSRQYSNHPQLKINRGELSPVKVDQTRNLIGDEQTALIEYLGTENNVYMFVLTLEPLAKSASARASKSANKAMVVLKVYPLNIESGGLIEVVSQFEDSLANRSDAARERSRSLYDLLLKPAQEQLAGKTKIIVVPDGVLWRVPFEALQPAADRYLIDEASVSYIPSLATLRETAARRE